MRPAAPAPLLETWRAGFVAAARRFYLVPEVMSRHDRDDVSILHAFVRGLDDAVDSAPNRFEAAERVERVEAEIEGSVPARPVVAALLEVVERTEMGIEPVRAFLSGMRYDLGPARVADDDALIRYAHLVSSSVGLMIYSILGIREEAARARAVDLGIALQLTDVALDVVEDAALGRVYLPADRLARRGVRPGEVLDGSADRLAVTAVVGEVVDLAEPYYASGLEGMPDVPLLYRHGLMLMSRLYRAAGLRAKRGLPPRLPAGQVALRFAETLRLALTPAQIGLASRGPHDPELHRAITGRPLAGVTPAGSS